MTGSSINRAINKNCSLVFMSNKYQPRRPGVLFLIGMITCGVLENNLASNSLLKGFIFFYAVSIYYNILVFAISSEMGCLVLT